MSKPQILHIMQCANLGGMEQSTIEMMSALRALGCNNRLVSLNPVGGLQGPLEQRGLPFTGLKYSGPAGMLSIPAMAKEFRRTPETDAIVMSGHNMSAFAALTGIQCKRKILFIHFHHEGVKRAWEWKLIYASAMRIFPRIAFASDFIRTEAEEIFPPLRHVSVTRPNCFQLPMLPSVEDRTAAREALGIKPNAFVVGNAGWLIERKRWDVFLRTAAHIAKCYPDAVFLGCGDGPLRNKLIQESSALGLGSRMRWLGWQQDLKPFYLSLDVLLFNSDWDALGRTPLEAGAYQVPVVASVLNGGLKKIISSEDVGFLIDRHDEEWLAEKTMLLLRSPELRHGMGLACRKVLAERHNPERNARELLRLLGFLDQAQG